MKYTSCELIYARNISFMQGDDAVQVLQEEVTILVQLQPVLTNNSTRWPS